MPPQPYRPKHEQRGQRLSACFVRDGPPLVLILLVLGSIFAGIATPTEAGGFGAVGAMVLAKLNGRLNRSLGWSHG